MSHTLSVLVENKFGVLARVAGMFSGRGFNIDTLNVGPTHDPQLSHITATLKTSGDQLEQAIKQLHKLVNVIEVKDFQQGQFVARELIMLKVKADSKTRTEIAQICDIFRAKVINVTTADLIIEMSGNQNKVKAFLEMVKPFGILEMARTGPVALERKSLAAEDDAGEA